MEGITHFFSQKITKKPSRNSFNPLVLRIIANGDKLNDIFSNIMASSW